MPKDPVDAAATARQETEFLAAMEARPIPVDNLIEEIRALLACGQSSAAANYLQMLEDALVEATDRDGLLRLLRFRASSREADRAFSLFCRELLAETWKERDAAAFLEAAGFGDRTAAEALGRLDRLLACKPGAMFLDKTWGFGVVQRVDAFYRKIVMNFNGKPGHQLTFASAAETLTPIDATHLLAHAHADPAAIARIAAEQADEIVRMALRSFGALSVVRLEQLLTEHHIVAAANWKSFWDRARKGLKADPLVELPAKRSDPIVLHARTREYGPAWVANFAKERDPAKILTDVEAFCEATDGTFDEAARPVLLARLAFAAKGAWNTDPALYARLAALMERTRLEAVPPAEMRAHLWDQNRFHKAAERLTARDTARLVKVLLVDADAPARLLAVLHEMPFALLDETLTALRETPSLPAAQSRCRELLLSPQAPATLVVWIFRHRDNLTGWPLPGLTELLAHAILLIEAPLSGEELRMQNHMRQLFENARWFSSVLEELDIAGRRALFDRLQASTGWDSTTQRSLMGRMIKFDPALTERLRATDNANSANKPPARVTSWHSLQERRLQYKRLVEIELPKTSQDIAVARSYGDLRENFEYHAAKHAQSLLLHRQSEMNQELQQVQGTDFADAATAVVGMGVSVRLAYPDGRTGYFCILGEWDRDEALGIISCKSRMAQCLEGCKPGTSVQVPGEHGDETVTITAVEPLSPAIREWIGSPA
ncbi:MAG: GreA/GreB family elongation factor [Kiritimatiellia bacterium]